MGRSGTYNAYLILIVLDAPSSSSIRQQIVPTPFTLSNPPTPLTLRCSISVKVEKCLQFFLMHIEA